MSNQFLTVQEAARIAGKSTKTIYHWISTGKISSTKGKNGHKLIAASELIRVTEVDSNSETPDRVQRLDRETLDISEVRVLEERVKAMEALLKEKDLRISELKEDKSTLKDDLDRAKLLLEDKSSKKLSGLIRKFGF